MKLPLGPGALLAILLRLGSQPSIAYGQTSTTLEFPTLKQSPPYDRTQKQTYPAFTYQPASAAHLVELRERYQLAQVAGRGSETDRVLRLLAWFHAQVPHIDGPNLDTLTAINIIEKYRKVKAPQGCYPLAIALNEVLLAMGFKSRTVICFSAKYPTPSGGHVITSVYIDSLRKWIYLDPQENAYIKDEQGHFLSIAEVRERLIDGRPLVLNASANYHGVPTKKEDYLYTFMMTHLYRMICPLNSEWDSQSRHAGKTLTYVELLPYGSRDPAIDGFETKQTAKGSVITYHTNNDLLFWQQP